MHLTLSQWSPPHTPTSFLYPIRASLSVAQAQTLPGEKAEKHQGSSPGTHVRAGDFLRMLWRHL